MGEVVVIEKPADVSYEQIRELLQEAHKVNFDKDIVLQSTKMTADEIEKKIGPDGQCFVAMNGNEVVGTSSYRIVKMNRWFAKGDVVEKIFTGVKPGFKGQHLSTRLHNIIEENAISKGYTMLCFDTAENNDLIQKINIGRGFKYVNYFASESAHYSVQMVKYLDKCPFSERYRKIRYNLKRFYIRLRYKPGHIKRFGI